MQIKKFPLIKIKSFSWLSDITLVFEKEAQAAGLRFYQPLI